ncbi:hypothetical protein F5051DRAFT_409095 [Lentinula edodes]|uniref:Thioesterase domain-containing protein n=1 Tax=Lentinula lateritia TaxID=40482 RepID=A0A9W9DSZ2_9AGAR|nr:hypothetical protein HHX47_DHR1000205 [Lentinula edodes]KAJ3877254.1 hypothetical protein F5051DRAFT_409095 [Lentinula edodes]KAJ3886701.1 hypothetical protein GG344DRAFT_81455 [Lentinula edodes]KAJ4482918.1 hypothetical protein C8J55DRAFT_559749 [Lentinula edodes]
MSHIEGNLPLVMKEENERFFRHFVGTPQTSFGADIGKNIRLTSANVFLPNELEGKTGSEAEKAKKSAETVTICEIDVTKDMCNIYGTLHGGCAAYIIDLCSSTSIVCYGLYTGTDGTGVSSSMNIHWHKPITLGKKLKVVSNTIFVDGLIRNARSELRDQQTNQLYVSAVHSTIAGGSRTAALRKSNKDKVEKTKL